LFPGKTEDFKNLANEINGQKHEEFEASHKRTGIIKEKWYIQSTPHGDMINVYIEAKDLGKMFQEFGASQNPFDLWIKAAFKDMHGIDYNKPLPGQPPMQILDF